MLMKMCFPKFDIYHKLKQTQTLDVLFFLITDVRSEIHLVRRNIVSTVQSIRA